MNIPQQFGDLTDSIIQSEGGGCALQTSYTPDQDASAFDWEMIVWIYQELHPLEREKGLNHWEAVEYLYHREQKLPMSLSGKSRKEPQFQIGL